MKIIRHLRLLFGLIAVLTLLLSTPLLDAHSVAYAQGGDLRETIVLADGTRVVKDMIVAYPASGGDNLRVRSLPNSLDVSLGCGIIDPGLLTAAQMACPLDYTLTKENASSPAYKLEPTVGTPEENLAEDYVTVVEILSDYLNTQGACVTDARLVVAGGGWHSGGGGWHSGGGGWHSGGGGWHSGGGGATVTYAEAYDAQWSLEMVERTANLYGTGDGQTVAFLDVFDHAAAAQSYLTIMEDPDIDFAKPLAGSPDLSLHGNIVHNVFYSIAPNVSYSNNQLTQDAIGIPVFNSAGEAINVSVVRGVEFAIEELPANSIINMSFGIDVDALDTCTYNRLEDLFEEAKDKGITMVASAGNSGSSESEYPAASDYVYSVAAVGPDRKQTTYSNDGDIAAPGGTDELGVIARVPFVNDLSTAYEHRFAEVIGTSFAAPYVSAVVANLLSDGYPVDSISTKLAQITESNCGIVSLNTHYAPECLAYQKIDRADYGFQRLPHPEHGPNPRSWNTEPYWIGKPPSCVTNEQGDTVCYSDSENVTRPYLYLQGRRVIDGTSYTDALKALAAYRDAVDAHGSAAVRLESFGIQLVPYQIGNDLIDLPFWFDLPPICDEYGDSFDAEACASITIVPPPAEGPSDFYYHGERPVKPDMIIMDNHPSCSRFDGKVFDNASQAACIYRSTLAAMKDLASTEDEGGNGPVVVTPNPPPIQQARNELQLIAASTPEEELMIEALLSTETIADQNAIRSSAKIYVPMVMQ